MLAKRLAALAVTLATSVPAVAQDGPRFRADGPDAAAAYGLSENYPMCPGLTYIREWKCRVAAFSNFGALFPSREVKAPPADRVSPLKRAPREPEIRFQHDGRARTLDDYLNSQPVTGFLLAKDDTILIERYQYGRNDRHLMTSFSMAKSITGLLIGLALERGAIRSIDDAAEAYVPELKGTEYGRTPLKALLQMASGVAFDENYDNPASDIYTLARLTLEQEPVGSFEAVRRFNTRLHPPGKHFSYSSAESLVLGLVLAKAIKRPVAEFASQALWQPLGAESKANWNIDATGQEVTYAYYNAVLRDWARVGLMMAHGGKWAGRTVVAERWVREMTSVQPDAPSPTYGYQIWISPFDPSRFYFRGLRNQFVLVDPKIKLVAVQTALAGGEPALLELVAYFTAARAQLQNLRRTRHRRAARRRDSAVAGADGAGAQIRLPCRSGK